MKKILAIGAYERDNFGDILFYHATKHYLSSAVDLVPASILHKRQTSYFPEEVLTYGTLLNEQKWDAVILVGGEIGGINLESALRMSLDENIYNEYKELGKENQKKVISVITGGLSNVDQAYFPNLSNYTLNKDTPLFINSVGLSKINFNKKTVKVTKIIKNANIISVRDEDSQRHCINHGIKSIMAPDIIHTIPFWHGTQKQQTSNKKESPYILLQINTHNFNKHGVDAIKDQIIKIIERTGIRIYLFSAGTAFGHDSMAMYAKIVELLPEKYKPKIKIIFERDPFKLVEYIQKAEIWIGSSLHGRIIACSYNIPRIGLVNDKLSSYSSIWDNVYPFNIKINELSEQIVKALDITKDVNSLKHTEELSFLAEKNILGIRDIINAL